MYDLIPIEIASSGMAAQRLRLGVIASNLANAQSTRSADGTGPYQRRVTIFQANTLPSFAEMLGTERGAAPGAAMDTAAAAEPLRSRALVEEHLRGVSVVGISRNPSVRRVYDPNHEDADAQGYVTYPDISIIQEMTDMIAAERCYGANLAVAKNTKDMILQTLELLKS